MLEHARSPARGSVLLVCLGVLMVLAIFAVAFSRLMTVEQGASQIYVVHTQARFAAEAGIAAGVERLRKDYTTVLVDSGTYDWMYGDTADTPVEYATMPSYGKDGAGNYQTITVAGRVYGYSGTVTNPPTLNLAPNNGAHYVLKITDLSGRINLNDRIVGSAADDARMATFINNLGRGITQYAGKPNPVNGRGAQIIAYRNGLPGGQFKSLSDLYRMPGFSKAEIDLLTQYVTVHGWKDTVLVPAPQSNSSDMNLNFSMTQRTPVNINTAPEPVLFALIRGVQARCLFPGANGHTLTTSVAFDDSQTGDLLSQIMSRRNSDKPFVSFYDLARFFHNQLDDGFNYYMPILMANLNPSTKLVKFNNDWNLNTLGVGENSSDPGILPLCDKSDLIYNTTEVCFASTGYFEVTSLGRIVPFSRMEIGASYKITQTVKLFDVMRHTTQQDFEGGITGINRCRTYPENMPDQGLPINASRGSALDGQIVLDDRRANLINTTWWSDCDTGLQHFSNMNGRWSAMRWTSDIRLAGLPANQRSYDLHHNRPAYSAEGVPPRAQRPYERQVLNELLASSYRTESYWSQLHPDGMWFNQYGTRYGPNYNEQVFDAVDGDTSSRWGNAIFYPPGGRVEFWCKPDTRYKNLDSAITAVFNSKIFDRDAQVPFSGFSRGSPMAYFDVTDMLPWWQLRYFQCSGVAGSVHAACRKPVDWVYPDGALMYRDFAAYRRVADIDSLMSPFQWNHIRLQWYNWDFKPFRINGRTVFAIVAYQIYVNGRMVYNSGFQMEFYTWRWRFYWVMPGDNQLGYVRYGYFDNDPNWYWGSYSSRRSTATVDQLRAGRSWDGSNNNHYNPTNGWSYFSSRFTLGSQARILSIRYTEYPGQSNKNMGNQNIASTRLFWSAGGKIGDTRDEVYKHADHNHPMDQKAPADVVDATDSQLTYTIRMYDNGQRPFFQSPYVDDVTIFYTRGMQILDRVEGL
ncbi:MAG: hypothetical protein HY720_10865 [Planctomycetes bacterium]|nr:hypothetical protein [Planctomycetota bacterium]